MSRDSRPKVTVPAGINTSGHPMAPSIGAYRSIFAALRIVSFSHRMLKRPKAKEPPHSIAFRGKVPILTRYACHFNTLTSPCRIRTHHRRDGDETGHRPPNPNATTAPSPSISTMKPPTRSSFDGQAVVEVVLAFILALGVPLAHPSTGNGGGGLTRHSQHLAPPMHEV